MKDESDESLSEQGCPPTRAWLRESVWADVVLPFSVFSLSPVVGIGPEGRCPQDRLPTTAKFGFLGNAQQRLRRTEWICELPSREGAPGRLDRASGFPFPL